MDILTIIQNLCKGRVKFKARIEGVNETFESYFLKTYTDKGGTHIEIRNFSPYSGDTYLKTVKQLQCEFMLENKPYYFYTHHIKTINTDSFPVHLIEMPREIYQHQRRRFFRVSPSDEIPVKCKMAIETDKDGNMGYVDNINITDISIGGLLIETGSIVLNFELNQEIPEIIINLANLKKPIIVKGVIRRVSKLAGIKGETIGLEFRDLHFDDEAKLSEYIENRLQEMHKERMNSIRRVEPRITTVKFV